VKPTGERTPHAPITQGDGHLIMRIEGEDGPRRIGLSDPPRAISDTSKSELPPGWGLVPRWMRKLLKR
jgi:hypothetical protein